MIELQPNEKILMILRHHWLMIAGKLISLAIFFILPFIIKALVNFLNLSYQLETLINPFLNLFSIIFILFLWAGLFIVLFNHFLDFWVITDKRIVDIKQKGIFHREVSECSLARVQDVNVEIEGLLATFLKFGTISVQTAGDAPNFSFKSITTPYKVKDLILQESQKFYHNIQQ